MTLGFSASCFTNLTCNTKRNRMNINLVLFRHFWAIVCISIDTWAARLQGVNPRACAHAREINPHTAVRGAAFDRLY